MNRYFIRIFVIVVIAVFAFSCKTAKLSDSDKYESKAVLLLRHLLKPIQTGRM